MKPAIFTYRRPATLHEALKLLEDTGDEGKIIAGGQSLVPMMNMRLARPEYLVDINDLDDLRYIHPFEEGIDIGALTRHDELERSAILRRLCPIVPTAAHFIGHYAIRQRGTIGGSMAHADPAAELPLLAVLLDATLTIASLENTRSQTAREFFLSMYTTDLQPSEILTAVRFPVIPPDSGWSFKEFSRRAGDFALVSAACTVQLNSSGSVEQLHLALGGADLIPISVDASIASFIGERPDARWRQAVAKAALNDLEPMSDVHASTQDRLDWLALTVDQVLTQSSLRANVEIGEQASHTPEEEKL